jgi:hypothetical protein
MISEAVYYATLSLKINLNNTNPEKFGGRRHKKSSSYVGRALLENYIYLGRIISANLSFSLLGREQELAPFS